MDPITLIVSAIALGAAAGIKDTATAAVKDAYSGLKRLIAKKYHDVDTKPLESKPSSSSKRESLAEDLSDAGAGEDGELTAAAQLLIEQVAVHDPEAATAVGVDLEDVRAAALRIRSIKAAGTGLRVNKGRFSGDIEIGSVESGQDTTSHRPS